MQSDLLYPETCRLYEVEVDDYGRELLSDYADVPCIYEQSTGYRHGNSQDAITGTPRLYLDPTDSFVSGHGMRLEEMVVRINPFDSDEAGQFFKITNVTPIRDVLLFNELRHLECDLVKVSGDFGYVS